ncbi:telomere repeat-binding protein 5 isoform X2 [Mercurialis annua]|uniref:telomere repeat-binding protein 5 isoform X2 n=1 Tax=Mercurialis annua TaxID=3986 RepID=UPI0024AE132C|nr:telomere repeat-binding protein 5 isoform X2 [Mercurialis annua]
MVLQKRLDYGFNGYQVPPTPRATRSVRRRGSFKKKADENQMCAFDLLAIVAGNLLHEKVSTPSSSNTSADKDQCTVVNNTVKKECKGNGMKVEAHDHDNRGRSFFVSEIVSQGNEQNRCSSDLNLGLASPVATSDCAEKFDAKKLSDCKLESETKKIIKDEPPKSVKVFNDTVANKHVSLSSYPTNRDDVIVDSRDDDENSSGCTHPSTTKKFYRPGPQSGDRRIRKILASKYWKVAPRLKDLTLTNTDGDLKPLYHKRKNYYNYQRSERLYPFKKRRHFVCGSQSNSEEGICKKLSSDSSKKHNNRDAAVFYHKMREATAASSSVAGHRNSFQPRDSHVKLRIKSFKVPELFIEIPENATVGLLKRTVMDAVTAILGGGLRIGVLLQGKKVRDDNKTLTQTGIAHSNQLDALGFSLEPNPSQPPPSLSPQDSSFLLSCDAPQPLSRYSPVRSMMHQATSCGSPEHAANLGNFMESDHDSAPSSTDMSIDRSTIGSKALIPLSEMHVETLAVAPAHRKSKQSEIVQRRIRRPFSVTEVEALVQAVEKLGTGRWRDVKLRAFDNAKHRTYVDLKTLWLLGPHFMRAFSWFNMFNKTVACMTG